MVEVEMTEGGGGGGGKSAMASSSSSVAAAVYQSPSPKGEGPVFQYHPYPPPLAGYENVIADPKLFMDTLEKLHATMGTKFMIPVVGGRDLDLHRLFVEVTARGGFEKIIRERKWKDVTAIFRFPATATNASFVLRKYYCSLLHHYEQIYFFKAKSWVPLSADVSPGSSTPVVPRQGRASPMLLPPEGHAPAMQPQKMNAAAVPPPLGGPSVYGVIDGKFESGYLITVTIGSEKLKGVLYQSAQNPASQVPHQSMRYQQASANNPGNATVVAPGMLRRRRRKKSEIKKRDPAHPKPNRSGYNFFFAEQHARLKPLYPGKDRQISRMIGELWTKMKEPERTVYQEKAVRDKERYRLEMEDYRERLRTGHVISYAVPIQQRPFEPDTEMGEANEKLNTGTGDPSQNPEDENSSGDSDSDSDEDEMEGTETSPGGEIGAENAGMENIGDEEVPEFQNRVYNYGNENLGSCSNFVMEMEMMNNSSVAMGKESMPREERESQASEQREAAPGEAKE